MVDTQSSYNRVAPEYARRMHGELVHKPFDRVMLDWLIQKANGGLICDMGCGPGQVARYLHDMGANACGIDLSPGMIEQARALNPGIDYQTGDMLALNGVPGGAYAAIAAFYSLIHIPRYRIMIALRELRRVLQPSGTLLVSFHLGTETRHFNELWGSPVDLDFCFFEREEMRHWLTEAGFTVEEAIERDPYPDVEVATRRAYIFARR
jgi:SAM-dependent methyltransferase